MDATDALSLGRFWAGALGGTVTDLGDGACRIDPPPGRPRTEAIWVNPMPEPRTGRTRVRLDPGIVGGTVEQLDGGAAGIRDAADLPWPTWIFQPVPGPKTVKNRAHWDVTTAVPTPDALVEAGATLDRSPDDEIYWWVLRDPEGNEFCAFAPKRTGAQSPAPAGVA